MKMIDVLNMMAKGEIKEGTKLKIGYKIYDYTNDYTDSETCSFVNQEDDRTELLEDNELITTDFLNKEVELIPPKEKKFLVELHIRGLLTIRNYLNYYDDGIKQWNELGSKSGAGFYQTCFTKQELKSIKLVREFLEDMEDKYTLIEVEDNENN
ncbi:hypothetical protein CIRMBP1232_02305 [Enterococcus cecorum]|nr:hypothetical protein CIRMBP1232_02305 [Enterococcus cecorum]CAI3592217.1 hypothetical protein CIRMBP1236_01002 [Enterococcus cecorum]